MAYSELIKNFNKIRDYMRDFYVYGFKSRDDYTKKSTRSYDDEKRRIESWLGNYMKFHQTADGKNVFLSIDSRATRHNPLYKAWKTKSLQMEILPFILLLWIFFLMDKNCHLGMSHIRWTNIWQGLSMQEYLTSLRSEKNSTNM